jgi:CSLREA domain-containing protein
MIRAAARRRACLTAAAAVSTAAAAPAAGAIEVNSLADPGNGSCNDGACTLREAIDLANSTPGTADTITFSSGLSGTIALNGPLGQLEVFSPMAITGPGPGTVTISGDSDSNGTPDTRILYANSDGVSISGLTFTKGSGKYNTGAGTYHGGAIYLFESTVSLNDVVITGNEVRNSRKGGGIWSGDSDLTITNSTIAGNRAPSFGGGVATDDVSGSHTGSLTIRNSLIAGNSADYGGGINASRLSSLRIERSTITGNTAGSYGGGGQSSNVAAVIENSTIAGNINAPGSGGGGWGFGSSSTGSLVSNSTIAANSAAYAGGILGTSATTGSVTIASSIIADNTTEEDLLALGDATLFTLINTLVERPPAEGLIQPPGSGNVLGADPQLSPLADNGGPTPTMLIAPTSPAVDTGNGIGLTTDQRGLARSVDQPGVGGNGADMGAVELGDSSAPNFTGRKKGKAKAGKPIKITVTSDEAGTVAADATARVGKKNVGFKSDSEGVAAGGSVTLKLKLAKKPARILKQAGRAKAKVFVQVEDAIGNTGEDTFKVKLK